MRPQALAATAVWTIAGVVAATALVRAHSGPPYPIVSNRIVGSYKISLWTDPDATDDGSAAGRFWVMIDPASAGAAVASGASVNVSIQPVDRPGPERAGSAVPVGHEESRRFVALVMDHEGPYNVHVIVDGPAGQAAIDAPVDATYDLRPRPALIAVFLMPFLLVGFLWVKLFLRRRG
jgi:hypothetical protein